jgi:hypothetical protein
MRQVVEYPRSDEELPLSTRKRIEEMLFAGYTREHLIISEHGEVAFDPEASAFEASMRRKHPELPRSAYMATVYPIRICVD